MRRRPTVRGRLALLRRELAGFAGVGAAAFVITAGTGNLLHGGLGLGPLTSNGVATVVAATFSYFANRGWTFRHRGRTGLRRGYALFFGLNAAGLAITELCIGIAHYVLDLRGALAYNVALVLGTGLATVFRFWSYRRWVFPAAVAPALGSTLGPVRTTRESARESARRSAPVPPRSYDSGRPALSARSRRAS